MEREKEDFSPSEDPRTIGAEEHHDSLGCVRWKRRMQKYFRDSEIRKSVRMRFRSLGEGTKVETDDRSALQHSLPPAFGF